MAVLARWGRAAAITLDCLLQQRIILSMGHAHGHKLAVRATELLLDIPPSDAIPQQGCQEAAILKFFCGMPGV